MFDFLSSLCFDLILACSISYRMFDLLSSLCFDLTLACSIPYRLFDFLPHVRFLSSPAGCDPRGDCFVGRKSIGAGLRGVARRLHGALICRVLFFVVGFIFLGPGVRGVARRLQSNCACVSNSHFVLGCVLVPRLCGAFCHLLFFCRLSRPAMNGLPGSKLHPSRHLSHETNHLEDSIKLVPKSDSYLVFPFGFGSHLRLTSITEARLKIQRFRSPEAGLERTRGE